jgi:hypothetical protein
MRLITLDRSPQKNLLNVYPLVAVAYLTTLYLASTVNRVMNVGKLVKSIGKMIAYPSAILSTISHMADYSGDAV